MMYERGVIAGSFDVIHPGYIRMFLEAKQVCKNLTIALQTDPTVERKQKQKCILSVEERIEILSSIKYIDRIVCYTIEQELIDLLKKEKFDIRILGDDYLNKQITGSDLTSYVHYLNRNHGWSTTKFKKLIYDSYEAKNE